MALPTRSRRIFLLLGRRLRWLEQHFLDLLDDFAAPEHLEESESRVRNEKGSRRRGHAQTNLKR